MGFPDRFAAGAIRLFFIPGGKPQLGRKQCAAFGAILFFIYTLLFTALHLVAVRARQWPEHLTPEHITYLADHAVLDTVRWFVAVGPPLAVIGALAGVLRYQMKRGTAEERAGGGGVFQAFAAMLLVFAYVPIVILGLPFMVIDRIFGTRLWGDGTSGLICFLGALLPTLTVILTFLSEGIEPPGTSGPILLSICGADSLLSWLIFKWADLGYLPEPQERAIPWRFSLASLVLAVLGLGMYLTLLSYLFDW